MSGDSMSKSGLSRRSFLKATGVTAGLAAFAGTTGSLTALAEEGNVEAPNGEQEFYVMCRSNCSGSCRWKAFVREDKLVRLEIAGYPNDGYRGGCLRGAAYIERIYSPTRIKQPMRRIGERGSDQWEAISWDEAIKEASQKLNEVAEKYGPKAVVFDCVSGQYGYINGQYSLFTRLSAVMGATKPTSSYDRNAGVGIDRVLGTGEWAFCNEPNSILDASLCVIWGTNPVYCAPQNWRWIQQAKENGTKVLTIDVIKSATAHRSSEWIQITPSTDGYLALAMANYIIENDLQNTEYLVQKSTGPFLVRRDTLKHLRKSDSISLAEEEPDDFYVWDKAVSAPVLVSEAIEPALEGSFVTPDGVEVDTAYTLLKEALSKYSISEASSLCGISEERITQLAVEFATERAVTVNITFGTDHYVNGHLTSWAIAILLALCGQFGKSGSGFSGTFTQTFTPGVRTYWFDTKQFKEYNTNIPEGLVPEIFATQKLEGKDYPMKAMVSYCHNPLGNMPGQAIWMDKVLSNIEYWVVLDMEMNDSARYADLVLPVASWYEKEDLRIAYNNPYMTLSQKAIEPLYDSKTDVEIIGLLGRGMGYEESFPVEHFSNDNKHFFDLIFSDDISVKRGYTYERLLEGEVFNYTNQEEGIPWVRGLSAPWPTESHRVQLYWENPKPRLSYGHDFSDRDPHEHIVYYREADESGPNSPLAAKYPLVYIQEHARFRTHTQWFETPILRELDPEPLAKVNSVDAQARGVESGDIVEVFNDRGHCVLKCLVDESIAPGILSIPKGWQRSQFIEGSYQEMTNPNMDPYADCTSHYDSRVDFRKWEG